MTEKRESLNIRTTGAIIAVLILIAIAAASACKTQSGERSGEAVSASATGVSEWKDFTLRDVDGRTVSLAQFIGRKPVLLYFWATWCPKCRESVPEINRIHRDPAGHGNVQILALDYMESPRKVRSFVTAKEVAFPVLLDREGEVARLYQVVGVPTYILLDRNGKVAYRGYDTPDVHKYLK